MADWLVVVCLVAPLVGWVALGFLTVWFEREDRRG